MSVSADRHPAHPADENPLAHVGEEVEYDWNNDPDSVVTHGSPDAEPTAPA